MSESNALTVSTPRGTDDDVVHARLSARARQRDLELHRAWRALTSTPALEGEHVRAEVEATAVRVTRGIRRELREVMRETAREHGVAIVAGAFFLGMALAVRRS